MLSATSRADADEVREAEHLEVSVDELGLPDFVGVRTDRKSTRLNSSHGYISYAVFCLKKKKKRAPQDRAPLQATLSHRPGRYTTTYQNKYDKIPLIHRSHPIQTVPRQTERLSYYPTE